MEDRRRAEGAGVRMSGRSESIETPLSCENGPVGTRGSRSEPALVSQVCVRFRKVFVRGKRTVFYVFCWLEN